MNKFWSKYTDSVFSGKSMIFLVVGGLIVGGILAILKIVSIIAPIMMIPIPKMRPLEIIIILSE